MSVTYEDTLAATYDATYDRLRTPSGDVAFYTRLAVASEDRQHEPLSGR